MHLLEVCDAFTQSVQVEVVSDIVLVDFDEKLVTLQVTKPLNPA